MKHTLTALLQDRPGALNRTVSLFRRRGFNIESLNVAPSETPGLSRVTIVVDEPNIDRVLSQFTRLIEVVHVTETANQYSVERETALVKVQPRGIAAAELAALCAEAGARVVDESESAMIVEITDAPDLVDAFIDAMRGLGVVAVTRSGRMVMPRGDVSTTLPRVSASPAREPFAQQGTNNVGAWLVPTTPAPFTSQADGASDEAAA
jgi:acetolactate synthase-1/3 small subunit